MSNINFMQVIKCKTCGGESIPFGQWSVNVKYTNTKQCCKSCNNTTTETKSDFFCSESCFTEWMIDKVNSNRDYCRERD